MKLGSFPIKGLGFRVCALTSTKEAESSSVKQLRMSRPRKIFVEEARHTWIPKVCELQSKLLKGAGTM